MKHICFKLSIFIVSVVFLNSCKNITKEKGTDDVLPDEEMYSGVEDFGESVSVFYMFPSPMEILEKFEDAELLYVPGLINSAGKQGDYLSSRSRALNIGVYITDLAYTSLLGRTSEALEYPETIRSLSAELGISDESFESLIDRVQENISKKDSLVGISNDLYFSLVEYLESGGQSQTIAEISSGAYIETMYIGLNSVDVYTDDHPVVKQIVDMKYPFENLLAQAESSNENGDSDALLEYLNQLKKVFDELEPEQSDTQIIRNEDGEIAITGGISFTMNEENFNEMKSRLNRIRTRITESAN